MNTPDLMAMTDDEFDVFMVAKFPKIFAERHLSCRETCMCWGFDGIGPGWRKLLHDLCTKLQWLYELTGVCARADQVKQKFGTLRFYYTETGSRRRTLKRTMYAAGRWLFKRVGINIPAYPDKLVSATIQDLVSLAESRSGWTCEVCGDLARTSGNGWVETLCPKHTAERDARKKDG